VHDVLKWLYDSHMLGRSTSPVVLQDAFDNRWAQGLNPSIRVIKRNESVEVYRESGAAMLATHYRDVFLPDRRKTLGLEEEFGLRLGGRHEYVGVIDRIARDPDGVIHIIDFKTTIRPPARLGKENALQIRSYGVAAIASHRVDRVRLEYQYLSNSRQLSEDFDRQDAHRVTTTLVRRIDQLHQASEFPKKTSAFCAGCGYQSLCERESVGGPRDGYSGLQCPECGGLLERRRGGHGHFMGCVNFPRCRYTRHP
jgi:CRISPR/Cas system-associated exonuclease Cas4 (RecB family)